jgi:hypothetical protein
VAAVEAPVARQNNGQAQLNTANGHVRIQPPPNIPMIQVVNFGLHTGMDAAGPHALTPAITFSAIPRW